MGTARRKEWLLLSSLVVWLLSLSFSAHALTIIPTFDFSVTSNTNSSAVMADVQTAINFYQSTFTAPVTVQISFSEGGGPSGSGLGALSAPSFYVSDYNTVYKPALLAADATSVIGQIAISNLPSVPPGTEIAYTSAAGRAIGLDTPPNPAFVANNGPYDGTISLGSANQYVIPPPGVPLNPNATSGLQAIQHEINEVLGIGGNTFVAPPTDRIGSTNLISQNVAGNFYLSIDGGRTLLAQLNAGTILGDNADYLGCGFVQGAVCFGQNVRLDAASPEVLSLIALGYGSSGGGATAPEPATGILLASGFAGIMAWQLQGKKLVFIP